MRKLTLVFIISFSVVFNGCFGYRDINRLMFPFMVLVDIDHDNRPVVYLETFRPFRGAQATSEKGERIIFKGRGKTVYEAMRDVNMSSSLKFNYTQNKILVFTQQAAEYGIDEFIDVFDRYHEYVIRPYIAVTVSPAEDFLKVKIKEEEFIGLYLKQLLDNEGASVRAVHVDVNQYMIRRLQGKETTPIPVIAIKKEQIEDVIEVRGGAIIKDDKMKALLPPQDGLGFNFLMNRLKAGSLEVMNPDNPGTFVSLEILRSHPKTEIIYDGKVVHLKKTINVKTEIVEAQRGLLLNGEKFKQVKKNSTDNIEKACKRVFEKYKDANLDIFEVKEELERKYPQLKIEDPLKITELELTVNENLAGSPDTLDFWN